VATTTSKISLAALTNEVRAAFHEYRSFAKAMDETLRAHNVATAPTREVLSCEIYAVIRMERRASTIPYTVENFTEYVRTLLHYCVTFDEAMKNAFEQYRIENYSDESAMLYDHVSHTLNRRSLGAQVRERSNFTKPQQFALVPYSGF